jgi:protein gp37
MSAGCKYCYAETMAKRLKAMGKPQYKRVVGDNGRWTGKLEFVPPAADIPIKRKKPSVYFVNSMSDLFHEQVDYKTIKYIWQIMDIAKRHTFQVLTKRAGRLLEIVPHLVDEVGLLSNVWLGVSVENAGAAGRIEQLRRTPAAIRFISFEPLLGDVGSIDLGGIDWAIVGGESGHNARPMHPEWARSIRDQCQEAGVAFFFKQWGEWLPLDQFSFHQIGLEKGKPHQFITLDPKRPQRLELSAFKVRKKQAGRLLDGELWDEYPAVFRGNG